jgi:alpha-N-acetylglucosaminidase
MKNYYDPEDTRRAAQLMNSVAEKFRGNNNFEYDLVDIIRQAMADQARIQYQRVVADYKAFARSQFKKDVQIFLKMIDMQDQLLGTRTEFRLGHWTEAARRCGSTEEEKDWLEWNARVQITTWGLRYNADIGKLRDYAHKEWQGILKDFYKMRWMAYFKLLEEDMEKASKPDLELVGEGHNSNKTADELMQMAKPQEISLDFYALEEPWTLDHQRYSEQPEGNPVDMAAKAMELINNI